MDDFELFEKIKQREKEAFDLLFRRYYTSLCRFSFVICQSREDSEESVQDMFVQFWEKASQLEIDISIKAYLYTSTRNYTLNTIKRGQIEQNHQGKYVELMDTDDDDKDKIADTDLSKLIQAGVNTLPEKCREIFVMCKQEGLTYEEIATYLDVSTKTVDNQMGIALRKLREYLQPKLQKMLIILLFYFLF